MNSSWQLKKFGECAELIRDTCRPDEIEEAPYIGLEHIEEGTLRLLEVGNSKDVTSVKSQFQSGDILFGKLRPYFRKVVRPSFSGVCSTDIWVLRAKNSIDQGYLFYWMASQEFVDSATQASEGTKMPRAKWDFLERLEKPVPPLREQRAIAHILGTLDDKIELNRQMNRTLEAMAQALFKSWFVDFEPFRNQGMQDSPLGEIPVGWRVVRLEEIACFVKGVSYRSEDLRESNTALVTLKSITRGGGYQHEGLKPYIGEYKPQQRLQPGEIVVAHTDLTQKAEVLGRAARVQAHPQLQTLVASLDLVVVRPTEERASNEFLYGMLSRDEFQEHAYGYANGTTVLHLSAKALPQYQCVLPPSSVVGAFSKLVRPIYRLADNNEAQTIILADIRDALLPKLLSGNIRVKNTEKFLEEAA
ncbi:MAG: restriction endonuclease subunit S [Dehalococcoidales bacterium]|nr:restriction endonuclease subunit S [Dehalococcoidales bacterium]